MSIPPPFLLSNLDSGALPQRVTSCHGGSSQRRAGGSGVGNNDAARGPARGGSVLLAVSFQLTSTLPALCSFGNAGVFEQHNDSTVALSWGQ